MVWGVGTAAGAQDESIMLTTIKAETTRNNLLRIFLLLRENYPGVHLMNNKRTDVLRFLGYNLSG
jgi:hypothetical protein